MRLLPLLALGCLMSGIAAAPTAALAKSKMQGPVAAQVMRVIDGDTFEVRAMVWLDLEIKVHVRLAYVDAPEISRPECAAERQLGENAKALMEKLVGVGAISLHNIEYDKYAGRVVAEITTAKGEDLSTALVNAKLSDGVWCEE